jgi:uncharacterized surface protein with fasciclin (FAS1) repeats
MASLPAATAAAHNPQLVQLTRFIKAAGMTNMLNSAKAITIFAPDNAAFVALGQGNLTTLLASKSDLTKVLEYQVAIGRHTPADFANREHLTTLQGTAVLPAQSGRHWYIVNNADVVCGNIQTANATIYIVDRVLVPLR